MAYNDNYPNGYKSGYNSWDDPDRTISSPREGVPRPSGIYEESEYDKRRKEAAKRQAERDAQEAYETEKRINNNTRRDKEFKVAGIIKHEVLEAYRKQSWFKRFVEKRKGNDPYLRQSEIYNQAIEQAKSMSDMELDDIIRNGRTR